MGIRRAARCTFALAATTLLASAAMAQEVRTIQPGMTEGEVKGVFGEPRGTAARGSFTYYFYDNRCEPECGFPDLVIFRNSQVVDAVLRAPWHEYGGESSSPKGTVPRPTPGGMRLQIPGAVEAVEVRPAPPPVAPAEPDTVVADTAQADTARADTAGADTASVR